MKKNGITGAMAAVLAVMFISATTAMAAWQQLEAIDYPEGKTLDVSFQALPGAPQAKIAGKVGFAQGQATIELKYESMKPAILFGGDVTCYVLWAVTRDGNASNLGEFLVDRPKGQASYSTRQKAFAMLITAEPYYLVRQPSEMAVFKSNPSEHKKYPSVRFDFDGVVEAPHHAMEDISPIAWDSTVPLVLLQARKAFELAERDEAKKYAAGFLAEARESLESANTLQEKSPKSDKLLDAARRSVALSNEAINISKAHLESVKMDADLARRRAEMTEIEAQVLAAEARADTAREEAERLAVEASVLTERTASLQIEATNLRGQLQGALSTVAETRNSARGYVVNLPDILFGFNEATLKPEASVVLAKLAGILLMVSDLTVAVEGHTDSIGSREYNMGLSLRRADSVLEFLAGQGVPRSRLDAIGLGPDRPLATNDTEEGRGRNRRVEIVIANKSQREAGR